jgi:hypothetical protein
MNKSSRLLIAGIVMVVLAAPAFAVLPVRRASQNGTNQSAIFWNLFGPTRIINFNPTIKTSRQVICVNQDVEATQGNNAIRTRAGGCHSGNYLFIFQFLPVTTSTSVTNITITMDNLVGFTPDPNAPTFGVMLCDSTDTSVNGNTLERCSTATEAQVPNITTTISADNTSISFAIPKLPNFVPGVQDQGRGLALFVVTTQTAPVPVAAPRVFLK